MVPFLKIFAFVLSKLTDRPKESEAFWRLLIWFCRPAGVQESSTTSSANNSRDISSSPESNWKPYLPFCRTKSATSDVRLNKHPYFKELKNTSTRSYTCLDRWIIYTDFNIFTCSLLILSSFSAHVSSLLLKTTVKTLLTMFNPFTAEACKKNPD